MAILRALLGRGNTKLGETIHTWSLPAVVTCPGRSPLCERHCYARSGRYRTHTVQHVLAGNLQASAETTFCDRMVREIRRRGCHVVRVHVSGDFYSAEYTRSWVRVMHRCPRTRFYAYTRSWRQPAILPVLEEMATMPNVRLWYSCDPDTGMPPSISEGARVCWLQDADGEIDEDVRLVFRIRRLRREQPTHFPLRLICPPERPSEPDVSCSSCQRCFRDDD